MSGSEPERAARFGARVAPCLPRLLAGARLLVRDPARAEDVLQAGLLEAFRTYDPAQHDGRFHPRTWRCVVNAALGSERRARLRESFEVRFPEGSEDLVADLRAAQEHERVLSDPDRFLEETGDRLRSAVLALPDAERWVFLLRAMGDLSYREIADTLDAPIGSVMTWLHRARLRLREALVPRPARETDP